MHRSITFDQCIKKIDAKIYVKLQQKIDIYCQTKGLAPLAVVNKEITFEEYLTRGETDEKQRTQAITKFLQYWVNDALQEIIAEENLPIAPGGAAGCDWMYVGNEYYNPTTKQVISDANGLKIPIEFKTAGGKDGAVYCLGNLGVNVKVDVTLVVRYKLTGNRITHKQTVVDHDSARKWKENNPAKFNPETGESNSNYSNLRSKGLDLEGNSIDLHTLVFYSGTYKENQAKITKKGYQDGWIRMIKEEIVCA